MHSSFSPASVSSDTVCVCSTLLFLSWSVLAPTLVTHLDELSTFKWQPAWGWGNQRLWSLHRGRSSRRCMEPTCCNNNKMSTCMRVLTCFCCMLICAALWLLTYFSVTCCCLEEGEDGPVQRNVCSGPLRNSCTVRDHIKTKECLVPNQHTEI